VFCSRAEQDINMAFTTAARSRARSTALGVLFILLGIVAMFAPVFISFLLVKLMLIVAALEQTVHAFQSRRQNTFFVIVLLTVVYGAIAVMLWFKPLSGTMAVTAIIATLFALDGVMAVGLGMEMYRTARPSLWLFVGGVMSLVFAGSLLYRLPTTSARTIPWLVGIRMVVKGIEQITRWSPGIAPSAGAGKRAA
jgi:uncharacterized membrane protein HdeD (DUF308 family)